MKDKNLFIKYQTVDNFCIENLSENQLYFSDPTKFDDPFDCLVFWDGKDTKEFWINRIMSKENWDRDTTTNFIDSCINLGLFAVNGDLIYPSEDYHKEKKTFKYLHGDLEKNNIPGVCCFCKDDDDIRMWSTYANKHRGICLRFQFSVDWILNGIKEVKYIREIEPINPFDVDVESKVIDRLYKKFNIWADQNEYRILLNVNAFGKRAVNYNKSDLKGIIFGMKISREDATLVYNTIKEVYLDNEIDVEFCEAEIVRGKYEMKNKEIDDIDEYLKGLIPAESKPAQK